MKKLLSLMMITMLLLAAAACGSSEKAAETTAPAETAGPAESAAAETTDPASDEAKQKAEDQKNLLAAFSSQEFPQSVGSFETEDLEGNTVTEAYFSNADVTIVHIWATYCDPCLEEMENLGKMAQSLPENAQVLGIAADVDSADEAQKEVARAILADNNVTFPSVVTNSDFSTLLSSVVGVPTTFIVDSEGNVVAEPIVGSDVVGYKRMAKEYLDSLE